MAKHRLADREAAEPRTRTGISGILGRTKRHDDLYERSFRVCLRCGEHVYVLASSCRNCDEKAQLAPAS